MKHFLEINIFKKILLIAAFSIMLQLLFVAGSFAASSSVQKGLTLSPIKTEVNIYPGTSKDGKLKVTNSTLKTMTVELTSEAFSVINEQYDYNFTVESKTAKWVIFEKEFVELVPGASSDVKYSINVPLSAEPGGQYISMFASTDTSGAESSVTSKQRIASLLYITVMGDVTKTGRLVSLASPWYVGGDSMWSMSLQNTGTAHFRSKYKIRVIDLFGKVITSSSENESLILPNTIRSISGLVPQPKVPGIYKLSYDISLGDSPSRIETRYMLFVPSWLIDLLSLLIITSIIFVISKKKNTKKSKN